MFVVDDLLGWLIGRLADAGYQKLATHVRGSDQARALKKAVTAAVQATVDEIGPSGGEEPDRAAEQINRAFRRREPVPLPPGQPTLLEALQAGIAGQLSAVDDGGQPAVSLPGVPVSDVAPMLTRHLVREIQIRGSQPGPLTPLADQLNHDVTHLRGQRLEGQGQRLEGMLAQVLDWLGDGLVPPRGAAGPVGWPLAEVGDPFVLEVHRPVESDVPQPGLPVLPVYVPREHDAALTEIVTEAAAGAGGIAVLVGGSFTGKTRACWEALEPLRGAEPEWRLWHPVDPQAALAQLAGAGPGTVVWLNEAQRYLGPADGAGERVAAGLRELLRDQARGPVLVLATLWPGYWDQLTARPAGGADPHAQARELLAGHDIRVPAAFTPGQLRELGKAEDPRLVQAAAGSRDGQAIQYLAGAPELLGRYHNAPPAAQTLIHAAMDAARLGMSPALPRAFLETAAPGYLTDTDWDLLPGDWLEQALSYTAKPCKGVRGPLAPFRPRPAPGAPASPGSGPAWQLADYLDQHGRRARREKIPPASFWAAAASCAAPADLTALARAAEDRGLTRDAARLYKQASAHGHPRAGANLVGLLHIVHPGDPRAADWAAAHTSLDDPDDVAYLLTMLEAVGASGQVTRLASRAAAHTSLDDPYAVAELLEVLGEVGARGQFTTLLDRDPAAHTSLDDPRAVAELLKMLGDVGASGQVITLASRAAAHTSLDDPYAVADLLNVLAAVGASGQVTTLLDRAAAHTSLDNPHALAELLDALRRAGASGQVTTLLDRDPAAHTSLDNSYAVARLLDALGAVGASGQVTTLLDRDPAAHTRLDDPYAVADLLEVLGAVGASGQVTTLLDRDPAAHTRLDDPRAVADLLEVLGAVGASGQVTTLASRDPAAHTRLDDPRAVAYLLDALGAVGASGQVTTLLDRDPAAHTRLDDPRAVTYLLDALGAVGASGQVTTLASRDPAAHTRLDDPRAVTYLLDALGAVGASGQVTTLASRDPAAHTRLDDPRAVTYLLDALGAVGASGQVTTLASRAAAHTSLDDPAAVAELLDALGEEGAHAQASELIERLPAAGMFGLFLEQEGRKEKFRFGRETDGHPAKRWAWTDLSRSGHEI